MQILFITIYGLLTLIIHATLPWTVFKCTLIANNKLMKGKALRKQSLHEKTAIKLKFVQSLAIPSNKLKAADLQNKLENQIFQNISSNTYNSY